MVRIFEALLKRVDSIRLTLLSRSLINLLSRRDYAHNLFWFDAKIFQTPTDLFLYQQLIYDTRPTIIIETGVAKGGSVLFACQMLDLLYGASERKKWYVICCDINSIAEAQLLIHRHGYLENVTFFQGDSSSIGFSNLIATIVQQKDAPIILLSLDSNHTEEHVYAELVSLARFVSPKSYAIVWDSRIGDLTTLTHFLRPRDWSKKRHAGTGAKLFMASEYGRTFTYNKSFENNLLLTGVKNGVLQRN